VKATLLIFFLVTGIPAGVQFKQRHELEDRATTAAIRYAVFERNSKFVNYDLGQEDIEGRCSMAEQI
jgi:hypothetical protein